jgi:2-oxoglutarate dehydrogenase E1 component
MQDLESFRTGGSIHIVVNNQVGFTTNPAKARSGTYCTDIGKVIDAPIFHVNGDSIQDVVKVFRIAADYKSKFKQDVIIDLIGYRKAGHNELDQPSFTQPLMYKQVQKMTPIAKIYENELIADGTLTQQDADNIKTKVINIMEKAYNESKSHEFIVEDWKSEEWEVLKQDHLKFGLKFKDTGINLDKLREIGDKITTLPDTFVAHPQIKKIYEGRKKAISSGKGIDWGTAESLAFATLLMEGYSVRLSGQDVERGTFSHRHAVVFHQDKDSNYTPLTGVVPDGDARKFQVHNSHLSEYGVLGFEYGYA